MSYVHQPWARQVGISVLIPTENWDRDFKRSPIHRDRRDWGAQKSSKIEIKNRGE